MGLKWHLIILLFFLVVGILFSQGKGAFLISGYSLASKEQKAKIDKTKHCRLMSRLSFGMAGCWCLVAAGDVWNKAIFLQAGAVLFVLVSLGGLIFINTGGRIKR